MLHRLNEETELKSSDYNDLYETYSSLRLELTYTHRN